MNDYQEIPEYDEDIKCTNPLCVHSAAEVIAGLYGLFGGGGPGSYTMCENCGAVLSKTCDTHTRGEENESTEIKTPNVQDTDIDKS